MSIRERGRDAARSDSTDMGRSAPLDSPSNASAPPAGVVDRERSASSTFAARSWRTMCSCRSEASCSLRASSAASRRRTRSRSSATSFGAACGPVVESSGACAGLGVSSSSRLVAPRSSRSSATTAASTAFWNPTSDRSPDSVSDSPAECPGAAATGARALVEAASSPSAAGALPSWVASDWTDAPACSALLNVTPALGVLAAACAATGSGAGLITPCLLTVCAGGEMRAFAMSSFRSTPTSLSALDMVMWRIVWSKSSTTCSDFSRYLNIASCFSRRSTRARSAMPSRVSGAKPPCPWESYVVNRGESTRAPSWR
mmetsp:Transcript_45540/g.140400  ORF Transcript_45540/g.140400 Transcript_45540/m.140400 type:complete len:316 (+) Transcript_45540:365-1312(+)